MDNIKKTLIIKSIFKHIIYRIQRILSKRQRSKFSNSQILKLNFQIFKFSNFQIILFFFSVNTFAQSPAKIKQAADLSLTSNEYQEALDQYERIKDDYSKDIDLKYNMGLCFFHLNRMKEAILNLDFYLKNSKKINASAYYYLAKAEHLQNNFAAAAIHYKNYLKTLPDNALERAVFKCNIMQCTNGAKIAQISSNAVVSTLSDKINSPSDDYRICFNPRIPNSLFFSSNRKEATGGKLNQKNEKNETNGYYRSDIYQAELVEGNWERITPLSSRYNTPMSEDIISFFDGGYQMVLLKGYADGHKEVVKENFDEDSIEVVLPFGLGASSNYWDSDHFFINDSTVIFSSNRPGGYGGKDLYYAMFSMEKKWLEPVNLGPFINSKYNEVSPFLAKDGRTLYFSSDLPLSMGGYDIYKAIFQDSSRNFQQPQNLGTPINSAADDKDFFLDKDALKGYFSSNRIESIGGYDLYAAYFRTHLSEQLLGRTPKSFVDVLSNSQNIVYKNPTDNIFSKLTPSETNNSNTNNKTIYNLSPIYYNAQTGRVEGSQNTINTLAKLLARHPEMMVVLSAHSDNSGDMINDLFLSVKQAEDIAKELLKNGVQNQQIWLRGCGQNYPVANNQNFDGSPSDIGNTINRRVDIDIYNAGHLQDKISIQIIQPEVSSVMKNLAYERYQKTIKGLTYKVQITETASLFNHTLLAEITPVSTEKQPTDINVKYLVGLEKNFVEIKKIKDKITQKGFSKAQIIPYINGIRISIEEAQVLSEEYSDLKTFLIEN